MPKIKKFRLLDRNFEERGYEKMLSMCQGKSLYNNNIPRKKFYFNNKSYAWPNPLASEEQAAKYAGRDIADMTAFERWQEQGRLERELLWLESDAILFIDMSLYPARILYKQAWAMARIRKLKGAAAA